MTSVRKIAKRVLPEPVVRWLRKRRAGTIQKARLLREGTVAVLKSEPSADHVIGLEAMMFSTGDRSYANKLETSVRSATKGSDAHIRGTLALARWSFHDGRPDDSLRYLDDVQPSDHALRMAVDICRVDCLCELRDGQAALSLLSKVIGRQTDEQNLVLRVGHARSLLDGPAHHGSGPMVEALNTIYHDAGFGMLRRTLVIAPIGLDNISCEVPDAEPKGALTKVTVVVRLPDGSSDAVGISSLMRQSWRNLELVVVAGGDGRDRLSALDPTLLDDERVIFVDEASDGDAPLLSGLRHGTGELIMTHPSDAWAHPQRVEAQASALMVNPELRGTVSSHMYVADHLLPRPLGHAPREDLVGPNPNSVMLRASGAPADELLAEFDRMRANHSPVAGDLDMSEGIDLVNDGVPLTLSKRNVASATAAGKAMAS